MVENTEEEEMKVWTNKVWTLKEKESIATHRGSNQWEPDLPIFWTAHR